MATIASKEVPVIYLGVISLDPNYSSVAIEIAEVLKLLSNILSCRVDQYRCMDILNIKILPLLMKWANAGGLEKMLQTENREHRKEGNRETNYCGPSNYCTN